MFSKIEAHFDALLTKRDVLKACARHTVAVLLGEPIDPMTPETEKWAASVEARMWKDALRKDLSKETDPMGVDELRQLANLMDQQWGERIAQLREIEARPPAAAEPQSKAPASEKDAGLSGVARAMLALQLLPDTFCVVLAAFILEEEDSLERFTTSQIRRVLESENVSTTNPGSLISSLAQKETPDLNLHGKSGRRQELLASLTPETSQRVRKQLTEFKARSVA